MSDTPESETPGSETPASQNPASQNPASDTPAPDHDHAVYGISVAAELTGLGMQNLRLYEARGLLEPARTEGGTRRYSNRDLERLRRIGDLLGDGLNLAGIAQVLRLETENARLREERDKA